MATEMEETEGSIKWRFFPLTLDLSRDPKETFIKFIMPHVAPQWDKDNLSILRVDDGGLSCSNQLFGFYQSSTDIESEGNVILVRINGKNTEQFTDRRKEVVAMVTLHQLGQGNPPLYFEFSNGICFGYAPGRPVREDDYKSDVILTSIMSAIAHLHTITLPHGFHGNSSILPNMIRNLLGLLPENFTDPKINETFEKVFKSLETLRKEAEDTIRLLSTFRSPLVYCHNDLQHGNIIYDPRKERCVIIDHEFGGVNYLSCELGDLFSEQAGLDMPDYTKYPDEETQKKMIRIYLEESAKIKAGNSPDTPIKVTEEEIHQLYLEANKGCVVMDFMWALWSLVQVQLKGLIEGGFDYLEYSKCRYGHYCELKDKVKYMT